ncbi:3-deoxy-D-manno-octulosonic acid transferase [bacterium]|nr:3-deoxy-D-manno-octulosonic acid transferase [bacterium]
MSYSYLIYNILIITASLLYLPYLFIKSKILHQKSHILEKLGVLPKKSSSFSKCIWFHAVSVGEVLAAQPIIKETKRAFPDQNIVLSVWTKTGFEIASKKIEEINLLFYFPFDIYWVVKNFLRKINPSLIIILETEIWPNFLYLANKMNIPIILANGRISKKSLSKYRIIPKKFSREVLDKHTMFCMQSEGALKNIISLGANPQKVKIYGNSKFDQVYLKWTEQEKENLLVSLSLSKQDKIIVVGSSHKGEEELFIETFSLLKKDFINLRLIIAPRHLERIIEIESILKHKKISFFKYPQDSKKEAEVIIVNTIGDLIKFYHLATIVIIGGSFVPVGGHNIIEPAFLKKPMIVGPYMENFSDLVELFKEKDACLQVENKLYLKDIIKDLLLKEETRLNLGLNAYQVAKENQGTSEKIIELWKYLKILHGR